MATVMASPRRPPLPTGQAPPNVTHVRMGYTSHQSNNSSHNKTHEVAPPLPSRPIRRQNFETNSFIDRNTARAFSNPVERSQSESSQHHYHHQHQQQNTAHAGSSRSHEQTAFQPSLQRRLQQTAGDSTAPPPPTSRPPTRPPPQYESSPPPPPLSRPPARKQQIQTDKKVLPSLPPMSPPKTSDSANPSLDSRHTGVPGRQPKGGLHIAHSVDELGHTGVPERPPKGRLHSAPSVDGPRPFFNWGPYADGLGMAYSRHTGVPGRQPKSGHHIAHSVDEMGHTGMPERPPKGRLHSAASVDVSDFESRFRFHDPHDFPEPETSDVSPGKTYPSRSASVKKARDGKLGPL